MITEGRDSKRWPDPLKVKPERWHNNTPSAFEFPVFQAGPRSCLGDRMVCFVDLSISSISISSKKSCLLSLYGYINVGTFGDKNKSGSLDAWFRLLPSKNMQASTQIQCRLNTKY